MLEQILPRLRYLVLPGSPKPGETLAPEQLATYRYWKQYWQGLLDQINPGEKLNPEHFFDQDLVNVVLDGNQIVAMQSMKHYDLRCGLKDHGVFGPFTSDFWDFLGEKGIQRVFTYRWFRVDENYSYKKTGVSFSAVICDLSLRVYDLYQAKDLAYVAHSRTDIGASKVAKQFGWFEVGAPQILHGVPCAQLVLMGDRQTYPDANVNAITDQLWARRENFTHWDVGIATPARRRAA